ncbi:MAG: aldehyde ferredoxin oxidoreductase N-terminal domain-containing protein [Phycisphaerae bacterium]|jgi:aldehyde:ferredoxin oxidoreductase|nr:aldehyde ferredoxin oxidoreductase N-terminal domain-containing protein [Phycisphaerae bacterium]
MNGYAGKILKVDLTRRKITAIPTSKYEKWMGGHGMGSAIFFDLVKDKTIDGFDPANVVTMMTSPFSGTLVPGASARTEVQGIGVQSYPIGWFTRSNFGGRFAPMLKFAGWDGVVIVGKASSPVWIDIRDDNVQIRDCKPLGLWGKLTWDCQQAIWKYVAGKSGKYGDWISPTGKKGGRTTQHPAVVAIGPAGENLSRLGCLIHDASAAAGQGGFGGIWGSKNLKAVSVIGTGEIAISDPKALMATRLWQKANYSFDVDRLKTGGGSFEFHAPPAAIPIWREGRPKRPQRPKACVGCHSACRARYDDTLGNEGSCMATTFYPFARSLDIQRASTNLINQYGLNAVEMAHGMGYVLGLIRYGIFGRGKVPRCPLDFNKFGSLKFAEQFVKMVAYGDDGRGNASQFGKDVSGGFVWAAEKWGRRKEDLASGVLSFPYWGLPIHKEPRAQVYWGYGTILGDRDINEHDFDWLKWLASGYKSRGANPPIPAKYAAKLITDKMKPYQGDLHMFDFSESNIYSQHMVKLVAWHRHYTRFWKQSMLMCDVRWPDFFNVHAPLGVGSTGIAEPKYVKAITGKDFSFEDGIELGKKIWNLDHAIWTLQGRHRDMVHFADIVYNKVGTGTDVPNAYMVGCENGKWDYYPYTKRTLNRKKFDEFKTLFYKFHKWDTATGYPTRAALAPLGLGYVADELAKKGKLGGLKQ